MRSFNLSRELFAIIITSSLLFPAWSLTFNESDFIRAEDSFFKMNFDDQLFVIKYLYERVWVSIIIFLFLNPFPYLIARYFAMKYINFTLLKEIGFYFLFTCLSILISGYGLIFIKNVISDHIPGIILILIFSIVFISFKYFLLEVFRILIKYFG